MLTKHTIVVHYGWLNTPLALPPGTRLTRATNISEPGCYWVRSLPRALTDNMTAKERVRAGDWMSVYGFLIRPDQLTSPSSAATP